MNHNEDPVFFFLKVALTAVAIAVILIIVALSSTGCGDAESEVKGTWKSFGDACNDLNGEKAASYVDFERMLAIDSEGEDYVGDFSDQAEDLKQEFVASVDAGNETSGPIEFPMPDAIEFDESKSFAALYFYQFGETVNMEKNDGEWKITWANLF